MSLPISSLLFASVTAIASPTDPAPSEAAADAEVIQTDPTPRGPGRRPDLVAPVPDRDYAIMVNRRARGLGLGFRQGMWGKGFGQSLHLDVPFGRRVGQFFGARLAGTVVHGSIDDRYDPVMFGTVGLFARSPVLAGVVRAYGGGGVSYGGRLHPRIEGERYGLAGGGYLGLEAFVAPRVSISVDVGVQGPVHDRGLDGGGSVMGGVNVWLGALGRRGR